MQFNQECKVLIESMNKQEASAFVKFLRSEISRHQMDITNAVELIHQVVNKFHLEDVLDE